MSQPITAINFINEAICYNVCHQQIKKKRLTLKFLENDALKNIFNLERGLLRTIIELFKQPESLIRDFLDDDRYRYINRFLFLLVAASFYAILVRVFGFSAEAIIEVEDGNPMDLNFTKEYSNLIFLIKAPLVGLASWLAFRQAELCRTFGNQSLHFFVYDDYINSIRHYILSLFNIDRCFLRNDFISANHLGDFLHLYLILIKKCCKRHFENNTDLHLCRAFFNLDFHSNCNNY